MTDAPAPARLRVALLFGGRSSEHSISCATAGSVLAALDRSKYDVIPVGITTDGAFTLQPDDAAHFALGGERLPVVADDGSRVRWPDSAATRELTLVSATGEVSSLGDVDVVFPILHGPFGEDGSVQGMLELVGLPYVGAGILGSAVAMDKHFAKTVLQQAGIDVAPWVTVRARDWATRRAVVEERVEELGWPVFVKPARAGSSVGVSKATSLESLAPAMELALAEDNRVVVEAAVVGRELEIGVLGGVDGGAPRTSVAGEIVLSGLSFYDFDSKYLGAPGVELICPAPLGASELAEFQSLAARAFEAVGGAGLARVDVFLTDDGFVVNELNTMPGFTPISMFPACWLASGLTYPELLDELIALGLAEQR